MTSALLTSLPKAFKYELLVNHIFSVDATLSARKATLASGLNQRFDSHIRAVLSIFEKQLIYPV